MSTNPSATAHSQITPMPSDSILKFEPNIVVRPFRASDASSMAHHANNRKIWLRMTNAFPHPYTVEAAEDYIASNIDSTCFVASGPFDVQTSNGAGPKMPTKFALCIDDYCVGSIGITFLSDVTCRLARLGYWIGEDCWAKGILSKVAPAFVRWSMETFGRLMRIEGGVYEGNPASCRILEKCDMKYAHYYEKSIWKDGKLLGCHLYELVRDA